MLKLDFDKVIDFYTHEFGKSLKTSITDIVKRRHEKEKIYLSMDVDTEKSQPMTFKELCKFNKHRVWVLKNVLQIAEFGCTSLI